MLPLTTMSITAWLRYYADLEITRRCCGALLALAALLRAWKWHKQRKTEKKFSLKHGCQRPKPWSARWPGGLDVIIKTRKSAARQQTLQFFLELIGESGATFEQNLLGSRGICTIDPENIEAILSTNFADYNLGNRSAALRPLLGSGIFTQDGAEWKHSRHLLRPQFATNKARTFAQIQRCVEDVIDAIPENGVVDLQPLFFRLTFDTTLFLLFGDSVSEASWDSVTGQESAFSKAFTTAQQYLARRGRLGPWYWLCGDRAFREACAVCHRFVDDAVAKALNASSGKEFDVGDYDSRGEKGSYAFIDALVEETRNPQVIRDQCLNLLLAGRDTTGTCLGWTFRLLARHQKVLQRLRSEIQGILGLGRSALPPTRDHLKRMSYLNNVVKEVLRLYPSVPLNAREATRLTTLPIGGGPDGKAPVLVRPGERVGYSVYAMHRRKDIYGDDADDFRPERWEGDALRDIGWGYLPFNRGPRICLGQDFALMEVAYAVARIVQAFPEIEVPSPEPDVGIGMEKQLLTLIVGSAEGCVVLLKS